MGKGAKKEIDHIYKRIERMDTAYTELEVTFKDRIHDKEIEIEQLDPVEMNKKEAQIEF